MLRNNVQGPGRRGPPDLDGLQYHIDGIHARDPIRWVHNNIRNNFRTFYQGLFLGASRLGPAQHVQFYSERRQHQMLGFRLNRNPFLINDIFRDASAVVDSGNADARHEIDFVNATGQRTGQVLVEWDVGDNAFEQSLGADLRVDRIYKIEIMNPVQPNTIIMTLIVDFPPIY